jgi:hypothetical protein
MKIGDLAKRPGLSVHTLRYYEPSVRDDLFGWSRQCLPAGAR